MGSDGLTKRERKYQADSIAHDKMMDETILKQLENIGFEEANETEQSKQPTVKDAPKRRIESRRVRSPPQRPNTATFQLCELVMQQLHSLHQNPLPHGPEQRLDHELVHPSLHLESQRLLQTRPLCATMPPLQHPRPRWATPRAGKFHLSSMAKRPPLRSSQRPRESCPPKTTCSSMDSRLLGRKCGSAVRRRAALTMNRVSQNPLRCSPPWTKMKRRRTSN